MGRARREGKRGRGGGQVSESKGESDACGGVVYRVGAGYHGVAGGVGLDIANCVVILPRRAILCRSCRCRSPGRTASAPCLWQRSDGERWGGGSTQAKRMRRACSLGTNECSGVWNQALAGRFWTNPEAALETSTKGCPGIMHQRRTSRRKRKRRLNSAANGRHVSPGRSGPTASPHSTQCRDDCYLTGGNQSIQPQRTLAALVAKVGLELDRRAQALLQVVDAVLHVAAGAAALILGLTHCCVCLQGRRKRERRERERVEAQRE